MKSRALLSLCLGFLLTLGYPALAGEPEAEGQVFYQKRQFPEAIERWERALEGAERTGDRLALARILGNLALAYRQIGAWEKAETAMAEAVAILEREPKTNGPAAVLARTLNNRGTIELARGRTRQALDSWAAANALYRSLGDETGVFQSRVNEAIALKILGLYPRACENLASALQVPARVCRSAPEGMSLEEWEKELQTLPPTPDAVRVRAWHVLGETLELSGKPRFAATLFAGLLSRTEEPGQRARLYLSLGNIARDAGEWSEASRRYGEAIEAASDPLTRARGALALWKVYLDTGQAGRAIESLPGVWKELETLPPDTDKVAAEINWAVGLVRLREIGSGPGVPSATEIARILAGARAEAVRAGDIRLESLAVGELGALYEKGGQYDRARALTERALTLAETANAPEIAYRWQWQLGRILARTGERERAIVSYEEAVKTLNTIEGDLAAGARDVRFSFRERVEPVYRQLVSLLLQPDGTGQVPVEALARARKVIESLRAAELNNFFRAACVETRPRSVESIDPGAAIIYPIVLADRLAVILSLPGRPLQYYSAPVTAGELEKVVDEYRFHLVVRSRRDFFAPGRELYRWLIEPIESRLAENRIETLVFVLDGTLRNVPVGALYDGKQFLIEKYGVVLNTGLELLDPERLQRRGLSTLAAGLTRERDGFPPLYHVSEELKTIGDIVSSAILLDEAFTIESLRAEILSFPSPIVHIATHGQFSSNLDDTFLLAWDGRIGVEELDRLLREREEAGERAIELLVLSACETAAGDDRAALGLAGMAIRSGARTTLATLWPVNDEATTEFMSAFYRGLIEEKLTKAGALRRAQLELLRDERFQHPFYWSTYILLGNWL